MSIVLTVNGRSVLASALLAVVFIAAGMWALNNTTIGLNIKCRVFNDLGACVIMALTEPVSPTTGGGGPVYAPPPTESPEQRAAREAAEEQVRRDAAVQDASSALASAIDDLSSNADDLMSGAADMASSVKDLATSVDDGMSSAYSKLKGQTRVRPMDEFAQNDVCFALNDVEYARNDVDYAVNDVGYAEDPYTSALSDRLGYVSAVQDAIVNLNAAVAADGGRVSPQYTEADADAALSSSASAAKAAGSKADQATGDVAALVKAANDWMTRARRLAATVASC